RDCCLSLLCHSRGSGNPAPQNPSLPLDSRLRGNDGNREVAEPKCDCPVDGRGLGTSCRSRSCDGQRKDVRNTVPARLNRQAWPGTLQEVPMPDFTILSLDGGGTWALVQVMALIDLY